MKKTGLRRLLALTLCAAMVLGLLPGMSLTALAWDGNPYAGLVNSATTVKFFNKDWYIIADNSTAVDAGYVTLFAKDPIGGSAFNEKQGNGNAYSGSTVQQYLDNLTSIKGSFALAADAIAPTSLSDVGVTGAKLYLLSLDEARALKDQNPDILVCSQASGTFADDWWLRTSGNVMVNDNGTYYFATAVNCIDGTIYDGGILVDYTASVRPALKLDLSSVTFSSDSKKFLLPQTVSAENVTATYGDTDKRVSATADGNGAISYAVKAGSEDYIDVDASTGALTIKKVPEDGEAYVTATAAQTYIYAQATKDVTVTISKADLTITVKDQEYIYDGDPQGEGDPAYDDSDEIGKKVEVSGLQNNDELASIILTGWETEAGEYEGKIEITGAGIQNTAGKSANGNYNISFQKGKLTIKKRPVTFTGESAAMPYTDNEEELTGITVSSGAFEGLVKGHTHNVTYSAKGKEPGEYPGTITAKDDVVIKNGDEDVTKNYDITTAPGKLVIEQITDAFTISLEDAEYVYDGTPKANTHTPASSAEYGTTSFSYSFEETGTYVSDLSSLTRTDADEYTIYVKGTNPNYAGMAKTTSKLTITKAEPAVTPPKAKEGLICTGSAQELVTAGTAEGGEMQYAPGTDSKTAPTSGWSKDIPTGTDAGTYYVWYKVAGDKNHTDTEPACISVTIKEAPVNPTPEPTPDPGIEEKVTLKKVKITGTKSLSNHKAEISWKKLSKKQRKAAKMIEIQVCANKNFKNGVITKKVKSKKTSAVISGLKKGQKYYVRIRAYTEDGNIRYVSRWSKAKSFTIIKSFDH